MIEETTTIRISRSLHKILEDMSTSKKDSFEKIIRRLIKNERKEL